MVLIGDDEKNAWLGLVFKPLVVEIHSDIIVESEYCDPGSYISTNSTLGSI